MFIHEEFFTSFRVSFFFFRIVGIVWVLDEVFPGFHRISHVTSLGPIRVGLGGG